MVRRTRSEKLFWNDNKSLLSPLLKVHLLPCALCPVRSTPLLCPALQLIKTYGGVQQRGVASRAAVAMVRGLWKTTLFIATSKQTLFIKVLFICREEVDGSTAHEHTFPKAYLINFHLWDIPSEVRPLHCAGHELWLLIKHNGTGASQLQATAEKFIGQM